MTASNQKEKIKNCIAPTLDMIPGVLCLLAGLMLIFLPIEVTEPMLDELAFILAIMYGIRRFSELSEKGETKRAVGALVIGILLAAALFFFFGYLLDLLNLFLIILAFALFLIRSAIAVHMILCKVPGVGRCIFTALVNLSLGILLLIYERYDQVSLSFTVLGFYLIFAFFSSLGDWIAFGRGTDLDENKTKRRHHVGLPNIISATATKRLISFCGNYIEEHKDETTFVEQKDGTENYPVNFEVLIHVSRIKAPGKSFGHVDVAIGDTVYTYGCYDRTTYKVGNFIAGGNFVIVPKAPYLGECLTTQEKYIVSYGCSLSEKQMQAVEQRIAEILKDTRKLDPATFDREAHQNDGVSVYTDIGGTAYAVEKGPFKTYFGIESNCAKLADTIAGAAGIDAPAKGELHTPGAYFALMEHMFTRKSTRVIRRTVYLKPEPPQATEPDAE